MLKKITYLILSLLVMMQSVCSVGHCAIVAKGVVFGASEVVDLQEITIASHISTDGESGNIYDTDDTEGQSFVVTSSAYLASITVSVSEYNGDAQCTIRVGTSSDLSATYIEESDAATITSTGDIVFYFSKANQLVTGTTYYWLLRFPDGSFSSRFRLYHCGNTDGYSSGSPYNGDDWVSSSGSNNYDKSFVVKGVA